MNREIMRALGFKREINLVDSGKCPLCGKEVGKIKFRTKQDYEEYLISGMCQECMDEMFGVLEGNDE